MSFGLAVSQVIFLFSIYTPKKKEIKKKTQKNPQKTLPSLGSFLTPVFVR